MTRRHHPMVLRTVGAVGDLQDKSGLRFEFLCMPQLSEGSVQDLGMTLAPRTHGMDTITGHSVPRSLKYVFCSIASALKSLAIIPRQSMLEKWALCYNYFYVIYWTPPLNSWSPPRFGSSTRRCFDANLMPYTYRHRQQDLHLS